MALRNRIINFKPVATATPATVATLRAPEPRTVAKVATVAVADEKKGENREGDHCPAPCRDCHRLEVVEIQGKEVHGCLYEIPDADFPHGWKRLPVDMKKCIIH